MNIGGCPAVGGPYSAFCRISWWFCEDCEPHATLLNDESIEAGDLARLLAATEDSELAPLVHAYSRRVLLVPERNLLVIRGNLCNPGALEAVIEITPLKTQALLRMKVGTLEELVIAEPAPKG
jgi:hypothetical protein